MQSAITSQAVPAGSRALSQSGALFQAVRPGQWVKNGFVFAALLFSRHLSNVHDLLMVSGAALVFCFASGAVYLVNDVFDAAEDRLHPVKRLRPVASGALPEAAAVAAAAAMGGLAFAASAWLDRTLLLVVAVYAAINLLYSAWLKRVMLVDVFLISAGFVLRVLAGGLVIHVEISSWLIICTTLLALFLALSKRRHELVLMGGQSALHRATLEHYSPYFLDQLIAIVTASTVMSYALYTFSADARAKFPGRHLELTIPFVIFGIFRYLYLVHQREQGGNPTRMLFSDRVLLSSVLMWAAAIVLIIYF